MEFKKFKRQLVFDPIQRMIHWWNATVLVSLVILGWVEKLGDTINLSYSLTVAHIALGNALVLGFMLRIIWALLGPKQAHLSAFWLRLKHFRTKIKSEEDFGYEKAASLSYLLLYLVLLIAILSGLGLVGMRYDRGPFASSLFDELTWHEFLLAGHSMALYGVTLFIVAHLVGMILHEKKAGIPVAQAMVSGYQYRKNSDEENII